MSTERNDRLVSIPHVPHGPQGVAQDDADADYYRSAAENIRYHKVHGHAFAGSNVTEAVAKLCEAAADALSKPRTVTTIDELDAAVYAAFEDDGHLVLTDRQGRPWIIWADEDGDEVVNSWPQEEDPERLALSDIRLPATVMHHGARTLLHELETRA